MQPQGFFDTYIARLQTRASSPATTSAADTQKPEMLLIGCVDARLDPHKDIGIPAGKALIYRNIAALVCGFSDDAHHAHLGEEASLEYAIFKKKITDIVVMGHTQCSGIRACVCGTPHRYIQQYLMSLSSMRNAFANEGDDEETQLHQMEQEAVKLSLQKLKTYAWLKKLVDAGQVRLHGWVIDTATKCIAELAGDEAHFVPMRHHTTEDSAMMNRIRQLNEQRIALTKDKGLKASFNHPKALVIGGIDERVTASALGFEYGEALIYRCPSAYLHGEDDPRGRHNISAAAVIEFAIKQMEVTDIIVCGHRDSGGIKVVREEGGFEKVEEYLQSLFQKAATQHSLEEIAVMQSIENIKTYDGVAQRVAAGTLRINGLIYHPTHKTMEILSDGQFLPLAGLQ